MFDWRQHVYLRRAVQLLRQGGIIAYPTEAVWGLGADPFNAEAVASILSLKQRSVDKGLIVVAAGIEQLAPCQQLSPQQRRQLDTPQPAPVTWLVPNNGLFPPWICGRHANVAVRVSRHPVVRSLCLAFGGPIVSTSANPQGRPAPRFRWQARHYFRQRVDLYTPGCVGEYKRASEIRDLLSGQIIRRG